MKEQNKLNKMPLIPIIIAIAIVPLIVQYKEITNGLTGNVWFSSNPKSVDFFLYYKSRMIIFVGILCLIGIIYSWYNCKGKKSLINEKINLSKLFIPLAVYGVFIIFSTMLSKNIAFSINGIYEQFEPVWVLITYILIVYYCSLYVKNDNEVHYLIKALLWGAGIFALIGTFQMFSLDFFKSDFGKSIMTFFDAQVDTSKLNFRFQPGIAYSTVYNPDYIGSFVALVLPVFIMNSIGNKKVIYKILSAVLCVLLILSLYASGSATGMVAVVISLFFGFIFTKNFFYKKSLFWIVLGCVIVVAIIGVATKWNSIAERCSAFFETEDTSGGLQKILTADDAVEFYYNNTEFKVSYTDESEYKVVFKDKSNNEIQTTLADGKLNAQIDGVGQVQAGLTYVNNYSCFGVILDGKTWYFTNQLQQGGYYYYNVYGKFDKLVDIEEGLFGNKEMFANHRGYIWSRTLPLLKKTVFIGSGPDTFTLLFPNNDYVGLIKNDYAGSIVTKPHNMFLQIATQTGVLSLIAMLVFYIIYFIKSIQLYFKSEYKAWLDKIGLGIFIGTFGYMITGLANDSTVSVAPLFWGLLGIGVAVNQIIIQNQKKLINIKK